VAKTARVSCEACGDLLVDAWFSRHVGKGVQHLCPLCASDALARMEAEARRQIAELEAAWRLPFDSVGDPPEAA
jgi:hypothetical protein